MSQYFVIVKHHSQLIVKCDMTGKIQYNEIVDRILSKNRWGTEGSLAKQLGISANTWTAHKKGTASFGLNDITRICDVLEVSSSWLLYGTNEKSIVPQDGFAFVPRLDVTASAGNGAVTISEETEGMLAFRSDWLRDRGINPKMASALTVAGDSMEPVIRDGDILLVDRSIDFVKDNGIYVVVIGGLLVVKRVHTGMDGSVTLISDNTIYPTETICANEVSDLIFAGRVMWFGRSI